MSNREQCLVNSEVMNQSHSQALVSFHEAPSSMLLHHSESKLYPSVEIEGRQTSKREFSMQKTRLFGLFVTLVIFGTTDLSL